MFATRAITLLIISLALAAGAASVDAGTIETAVTSAGDSAKTAPAASGTAEAAVTAPPKPAGAPPAVAGSATSEVAAASAPDAKTAARSIKWLSSLDDALALSRQTQKPVLVDAVTGWCGWCRKMDRDTYSDREVIELCSAFVCLRVNPEEDPGFAAKYAVNEFPAILILKSDGTEIDRFYGYRIPSEFKKAVSDIAEKTKTK